MQAGKRIGELLVAAGLLDERQLETALARQEDAERRLGQILLDLGYVSELQLTQVLSHQLSVAWVSLDKVEYRPDLLRIVPEEVARDECLLPVHSRLGPDGVQILYLVMDDPTNVSAMERVSELADMNVRPLIAPRSELRTAIDVHYNELRVA